MLAMTVFNSPVGLRHAGNLWRPKFCKTQERPAG